MRNFIARLFIAVLVLASACFGQTAPTQHFVISANAANTYSGTVGNQPVSIVSAGFQVTKDLSVAYTRISNPADGTKPVYNMADANYTRELATLLPKSLTSKLVFDATNYLVTFQASAGKANSPTFNRIAAGAGIYLARPVANNAQLTFGYRFLMPGNVLVKVPSAGITFTF